MPFLVPGEARGLQAALHKEETLLDRLAAVDDVDSEELVRANHLRAQAQREDQLAG